MEPSKKDNIIDPIAYLDSKLKFGIIIGLTNSYPNDQELGAKVREFIKLNYKK